MSEAAENPPHILVVDDEESLRHGLVRGISRAGWTVTAVATGKEGVDAFVGGGFDAVLTDIRLPDLSGLDIVAILTEMDGAVPVVVMTGYGSMETALEAMRRGARDFVQKPFAVDDVVRVLERAIEERRISQENRRLRALVERRFADGGYEAVDAELRRLPPAGPRGAETTATNGAPGQGEDGTGADGLPPLKQAQRAFEVDYVERLLARTGGNVAAAARLAGISRPNFHKKLRTLGVDAHRFKQAARRGRTHDL
jgi:DNA-binding NtrC family response regulator